MGMKTHRSTKLVLGVICAVLAALMTPNKAWAATGDLDLTFGGGDGKVSTDALNMNNTDFAWGSYVYPDGRVLVTGEAFNGTNNDFVVLRYTADGVLDPSFANGGRYVLDTGSNDIARDVTATPDGTIFAVGATSDNRAVVALDEDGVPIPSFGVGGRASGGGTSVDVDPTTQKIITSGGSFGASRYLSNGSLDSSFGTGGTGEVSVPTGFGSTGAIAIEPDDGTDGDPDGRVVGAGTRSTNHGGFIEEDVVIFRLDDDGAPDATFGGGDGFVTFGGPGQTEREFGRDVVLQADGRILVAGDDDFAAGLIIRLLDDGALDTSFAAAGILRDTATIGFTGM
jgi:uncharacterized delta-60 repeat protein